MASRFLFPHTQQAAKTSLTTPQTRLYGHLRKLSPTAPEHCYSIVGEVLRGCWSNAPEPPEKPYQQLRKLTKRSFLSLTRLERALIFRRVNKT